MNEIEAAYLSGFTPTKDGLSFKDLKNEAIEWLTNTLFFI